MLSLSARFAGKRRRDESGFSLMELVVTTSVLMLVMTALLNMLDAATKQERRTTAVVDNQNAVMNAFNEITRETRGANPIDVSGLVDSSSLATSLTIWVGSASAGDRRRWRFQIDGQSRLVKQELDSAGTVILQRVLLPQIVNTASEPLFQYFSGAYAADEIYSLEALAQLATPATNASTPVTLSRCAVRIRIHVRSQGETVAPVYDATTDTEIRNTLPGGSGSAGAGGLGC